MAQEVASAYVSIGASTSGLGRAIRREFSGASASAGTAGATAASRFVAPIAAGLAALGIGKFFTNAVNEASDLAEAGTALEAVFGDAVGVVNKFAEGGAAALGQTTLQVKNAAQTFGVYANAAGLASGESAKFSTDLVSLSTDLASFYNADPSDVVNALGSALRGESEPMRQFGVLLDDATLKAQAMAMGIYDGNGPLTQQQKILAANAAIMEQTTVAQGDFAKTSAGLANQQRILAATWTNFTGAIGTAFLPAVTAVVTKLNELAGPVLSAVSGGIQGAMDSVTGFLAGFGEVDSLASFGETLFSMVQGGINNLIMAAPGLISEFVPKMVDGIISRYSLIIEAVSGVVQAVVTLLPTLLPTIITGAVQLFQGLITAITTIVPMLVQTVTTLIPTIIAALIAMHPALAEAALGLFTSLVNAIPLIVPPLLTAIVEMLPGILTTLLGMVPTLLESALTLFDSLVTAVIDTLPVLLETIFGMLPDIIGTVLEMLPNLIESALTLFLGLVMGLLEAIPTLLSSIIGMLPDILRQVLAMLPALLDAAITLFTGLVEAIPVILPELIGAIWELLPEIIGAIIEMVPDLVQAGVDLIGGLVRGLWNAAGSVGSALIDIAGSAIDGFKDFLGINSPSKLFEGFGLNIGQGLVGGMDDMQRDAKASMLGLVSGATVVPSAINSAVSGRGSLTADEMRAIAREQVQEFIRGVLAGTDAATAPIYDAMRDAPHAAGAM